MPTMANVDYGDEETEEEKLSISEYKHDGLSLIHTIPETRNEKSSNDSPDNNAN